MENIPQSNADFKAIDAVETATAHAVAVEESRKAQVEEAMSVAREETKNIFVRAMREVLTTGDEGTKTLLLQKIPLLCTDMLTMKRDISTIKQIGLYLLLGVGSLFLTLVGALLLRGI